MTRDEAVRMARDWCDNRHMDDSSFAHALADLLMAAEALAREAERALCLADCAAEAAEARTEWTQAGGPRAAGAWDCADRIRSRGERGPT